MQQLLHALDLAMLGDWEGAKRSLDDIHDPVAVRLNILLTDQQRRERERADAQAVARHELGNALSIAQANMEALVDGVLEATPERMSMIHDALQACSGLLEDLKKQSRPGATSQIRIETFDICALIESQIEWLGAIAQSKGVTVACCEHPVGASYRGDPDRTAMLLRNTLLGAVRYTPPGGRVRVTGARPNAEIELSIETGDGAGFSHISKFVETMGGDVRVVDQQPGCVRFTLHLPALAPAP